MYIEIKYQQIKIGAQVLIKDFQVSLLKYRKERVKNISQSTENAGVNHNKTNDIIKLNLKMQQSENSIVFTLFFDASILIVSLSILMFFIIFFF